ncbi:MAG: ribulose-phosphate 3-epimerase [bacterium]
MKIKIAPSILSADFSCLDREIKSVERGGADMLHIDVMDGHFVPNLTIVPAVVRSIRKVTKLPLDVHLMIERPEKFVDSFVKAGSDMITVHIEAVSRSTLKALKNKLNKEGVKLGVSLNPPTPFSKIKGILKLVDFFLIMSVNPGFGGQKFIPKVLPKIKRLRSEFRGDIAVDGGVNDKVAGALIRSGANILAAGSYIFGAKDRKQAIERIRNAS